MSQPPKKKVAKKAPRAAKSAKTAKKATAKKAVAKKAAKPAPAKKAARKKSGKGTTKSVEMKMRSDREKDHTKHRVLPKKKGLGVAAKFSIFVASLIAVLIFGSQFVSLKLATERVSDEIDNQGKLLCHTLIGGGKAWIQALEERTLKDLDDEDDSSNKMYGNLLVEAAVDNSSLEDILEGILFVQKNAENKDAVLFGKQINIAFGNETMLGSVERTDAHLSTGTAVRRFSLKMAEDPNYRVEVYLRSARLEELNSEMRNNMIITVAASLVLGIAGAMLLSGQVAKPIKSLANDMLKVASGELGHRTKVDNGDEIGVLAKAFNMMSTDLEIAHKAELEKLEMDRDLALAHDVQESLLPKEIPNAPGYHVVPYYRSAKDVGGDYYDVVRVDKNRIAVIVADVAGKGTQGAMIMAMTRGITRGIIEGTQSPAMALSQVNRNLARDLKPGSFVTAMCAIIDYETNELTVASAGHNAMIVVRHKKTNCEVVNPPGIALGFDKGPLFNKLIRDQKIQLRVGDRVVLYTDGVVEAMSPEREEYGDQRFRTFCVANAGKRSDVFVKELVASLDAHQSTGPQHDDITIVTLRKIK